ncbi:MAG: carboxylating nicotinate-nucleotide diphosphorylase [Methylocystaceae bacterium]
MWDINLDQLITRALQEDIGHGDLTTRFVVPPDLVGKAQIVAKDTGILAGMPAAERVFSLLDNKLLITTWQPEGSSLEPGKIIAEISGRVASILTGERVALNFLQHLSGVATRTHRLVSLMGGSKAVLVDTRKTTPGLRQLEKYATRMGGARNHRFGLYDGVMIKDNHIVAAGGSIAQAVARVRAAVPHTVKVEVEAEDLEMVTEALAAGADIILLDNMDIQMMRSAVAMIKGRALVEASGGINESTIAEVAATGVDMISVGAITHSAPALDISLDLITGIHR